MEEHRIDVMDDLNEDPERLDGWVGIIPKRRPVWQRWQPYLICVVMCPFCFSAEIIVVALLWIIISTIKVWTGEES
jgi:hypothetical protein